MFKKILSISLLAVSTFSPALHATSLELPVSNWGGRYGEMDVSNEFRAINSVGATAHMIGFFYNRYFANHFNFLVGVDIIEMEESANISVGLINTNTGETSNGHSNVDGIGIPLEIGAQYFTAGNKVELGANLGFMYYDITRGIEADGSCSNCPSEKLDVDNDLYLKPFFRFRVTQHFLMGINTNVFFDDNQLSNHLAIELAYTH